MTGFLIAWCLVFAQVGEVAWISRAEAPARNECLYSEEIDPSSTDWVHATANSSVTLDDATAPDGRLTADTLEDTGAFALILQDVTVADDSAAWTASVFIPKDSNESRFPEFGFEFKGGSTELESTVGLNTATGAAVIRVNESGAARFGVVDYSVDYWRLWVTANNNSSGNNYIRLLLLPASVDPLGTFCGACTGSTVFWGVQLVKRDKLGPYVGTEGEKEGL